ncbi:hypothetical protein DDB_G0274669 [Dictyostelium discoideum AX4]|uniref:Putative fatty acid elongase DDB_G0274669 n=1 Tax=Dictyostelium discoideum TaxID=44689 RepID=Y4669_DICDI|nr:hypothetical protein DDB_G0274669 [Dictyostelium discoideum AX4]Q555E8.1 RecName: Full=Putative fatty acid elongase DDB_G0274669; AltName: Full=3-keto acyl-CoA synthase DDB_G0274669; AltName: Full=Putative elongation of fatty acids protein DDB_G0274669; AltName: Full=Very-long-chain 3-oxoacyl-CoA synthase DDB_G0274669 [Dictyostelium discoideum]EAL70227.1 hypothetical protein DDB_G0274669 [Dictyostelium discoideum AX4]|eukprot:XP_644121.1 hypothetical protein DDB_G0274669 [Dictyostelium discoideum AX4]
METVQSIITEWTDPKSWEKLVQHSFKDSNWKELIDPVNYKFNFGVTPFSQFQIIPIVLVIYLVTIFSIKFLMKNRKPFSLKFISILHNAILCIWSLIMCVGVLYEIIKRVSNEGPLFTVCEDPNGGFDKGVTYYWSYIFYISKFYELLDTVIIVLKKKPLIFLHVYHHCKTVWWKKYITMIQILQFVCLGIAGVLHVYTINTIGCFTHYPAFAAAYSINFSFLFLFSKFFVKSYTPKNSNSNTNIKSKKID